MKDIISKYIKENQETKKSFEDLIRHVRSTNEKIQKSEVLNELKTLIYNGEVIELDKKLIDLTVLPQEFGYVNWGIGAMCWISKENSTNDYGLSFTNEDNLTMIANKKLALYGSKSIGKVIDLNGKRYFHIIENIEQKETKLICVYRKDNNSWCIVNSGVAIFNFVLDDASKEIDSLDNTKPVEYKDGDIYEFVSRFNELPTISSYVGNMADRGLESKIIKIATNIKDVEKSTLNFKSEDMDLFDKKFFSIDGVNTKDIDDAIAIEKMENGYKVWVAIADVSQFIKKNDENDKVAQERTTSVYFYTDTVHMLSRNLAEQYCSLNPNEEKPTLICELSFAEDGTVLNERFFNKKIKSYARLTYKDVDLILKNEVPKESKCVVSGELKNANDLIANDYLWIKNDLENFNTLSKKLSKPQISNYWINDRIEINIGTDGKVVDLYIEEQNVSDSQRIVETAMLEANKAAARLLYKKIPNFGLFRNQVAPLEEFERPKSAMYNGISDGHWGVGAEHYTHFTSPIRRYCDLIVHRLIKDILNNRELSYSNDEIDLITEKINMNQSKARQCTNREKKMLQEQYLQKLVEDKLLQPKNKIIDFTEGGVVIRNNQLIEQFIPLFKFDYNVSDLIKKFDFNNIDPKAKQEYIDGINNDWKIKSFIDKYHWLNERKEATYKVYGRDFSNENTDNAKKIKI